MSRQQDPPLGASSERVNEVSRAFWDSAVLRAGIKLGVFSLLEGSSLAAEHIASHLEASPRFMQAFLDACGALGLLERRGTEYTNAPAAADHLVPGKSGYVGNLVLHITNHWESWGRLDELVKEGRTMLPFETGYVDEPGYWSDYMLGQHDRAVSGQAQHLVQSIDLTGRCKLLDLGGGAASYSIALCRANPRLQAVVVDREEPLAIARRLVAESSLEDRVRLVEGDFYSADLGTDSDVVLISGVVLIKPEEECRRLFSRAYDTMVGGGVVIVQDFMRVDPSPIRSLLDAMMDLYVLIAFDPGAGDRPGDVISSWLADAGFQCLKTIPLPTHLALVTGEKPKQVA